MKIIMIGFHPNPSLVLAEQIAKRANIEMIMIADQIERISEHSKNIAERMDLLREQLTAEYTISMDEPKHRYGDKKYKNQSGNSYHN